MKDVGAAKRYAKALEQLAGKSGSGAVSDVLQGLSNMSLALSHEPKLARLLSSPLIGFEKKESLVKAVSSNKLFLRLAQLLIRRHRVGLVPAIHRELQALLDATQGLHRALIKTAAPLSDTQRKEVETALAKRLGGSVVGRFEVAVDLIGGIWMQTGDRIWDATVRGQIDSFRRTLVHSAN
jgi:F-type H+-transporting ATPase subunit delta